MDQWSQALSKNFDWQTYHQQRQPQTIAISSAQVLPVSGRLYNLVATIKNPNTDWAVTNLEYRFIVNGEPQERQYSFLNPAQDKFLLKLGFSFVGVIKTVEVEVLDLAWRRFENDSPQLDWQIENIRYQGPSVQTINEERIDIPAKVTWQAKNLSLYNLWQSDFQIALYNIDRLVAINTLRVEDWQALENKDLEAVWLNDLSRITKAEIKVDVNWLDQTNFKSDSILPENSDRFSL